MAKSERFFLAAALFHRPFDSSYLLAKLAGLTCCCALLEPEGRGFRNDQAAYDEGCPVF